MGIIQKQAIKGTVFSYIGVIIGFITTAVIYPHVLDPAQIGLLSVLLFSSLILADLGSLGFNSVTNRLFPYFRDPDKQHNGFLFLGFVVSFAGFLLSLIGFWFFRDYKISAENETSPLLIEHINYIVPLVLFSIFFKMLDFYYKVLYNAIPGVFLREVFQRVFFLTLIILMMMGIMDFDLFLFLYVIGYCLSAVIIFIMLVKNGHVNFKPQLSFIDKDLFRSIWKVALFGIPTSFVGVLVIRADVIMIEELLSLKMAGIYITTFYFAALISIPSRSLLKIASTIIADAWKENDLATIKDIYNKSTLTQYIIGGGIFILLWVNINNILGFLPEEYGAGRYVILFIGGVHLLNMLMGANGSIIATSIYFRYSAFFITTLGVLIIALNYFFIPIYGIIGAAIGSFIATLTVNIIRYLFVLGKLKLQPYNGKFIVITLMLAGSYYLAYIIPDMSLVENKYLAILIDAIIRSSVISLIFGSLVYFSKISEDINRSIDNILRYVTKK